MTEVRPGATAEPVTEVRPTVPAEPTTAQHSTAPSEAVKLPTQISEPAGGRGRTAAEPIAGRQGHRAGR